MLQQDWVSRNQLQKKGSDCHKGIDQNDLLMQVPFLKEGTKKISPKILMYELKMSTIVDAISILFIVLLDIFPIS